LWRKKRHGLLLILSDESFLDDIISLLTFKMAMPMEIVEVPDYVSDEEINKNETVKNKNKEKLKKRQRRWMEEMGFKNLTKDEQTVTKEGHWSYHYTNI